MSTSVALELLADVHRRAVVGYCRDEADTRISLERLVSGVICDLTEDFGEELNPVDVRTRLHHVHLPKLAEAGVVDYDPETNVVQYRGDPLVEELFVTVEDEA